MLIHSVTIVMFIISVVVNKGVGVGGGGGGGGVWGARGAVAPLHNYWGGLAPPPLYRNSDKYRYSPFYVQCCPLIILVFELYPYSWSHAAIFVLF